MNHPADFCGVFSLRELRDQDSHGRDLEEILAGRRLTRVRRGWFATLGADPVVVGAIRAGGVVSCLTALKMYGIWVPEHPLRVHVRACASTMRSAPPRKFCTAVGGATPEGRAIDDLSTALLHAVKCVDDEGAVAVFDSVLNQKLMTEWDLASLFARSKRVQRLLPKCDGRAQSGIETFARVRLRAKHVKLDVQVFLPCVAGWVDILIGRRLVLELDGKQTPPRSSSRRTESATLPLLKADTR
ncbi:hypothetical protein GOEFS_032_00150 [Gordonia effusa NBRC 100432]|uniref:Uncharacterized protein n=1 Tax=Gordonia effusa NBRC 100432 TaxID=1077974 RepID=H0QX68_9ACTN|nr:hypothetical protein [Gordonia effusa]GAB17419.1 hypothetical protein GOEFS_032_00150 [Gordonia effusa NBRC 100432]